MNPLAWIILAVVALMGLFVGSFLNVVIYRLPRACLSVVKQTRSRCPKCSIQLTWYDNIPLLSYLILLRGRCRGCGNPISWRYPLVEFLTCAIFLGLVAVDLTSFDIEYPMLTSGAWHLWAAHAFIAATLLSLSVIDMDFRILPDAITLPAIVIAPLMVFVLPQLMPELIWQPFGAASTTWIPRFNALANSLAGGAGAAGLLWGIGWLGSRAFRKPAMGLGDVKLFAGMGGILGIWFLLALVVASFAGSIIGILIMSIRKDRYVPFGPFLAFGMMVTLLWGADVLDWGLTVMSPAR